jgi:hypothetical protein
MEADAPKAEASGLTSSNHCVRPALGGCSLLQYSPALVLFAIMVADAARMADPDLWGHIRFGQAVIAQGHLILHDPYSYSAPSHLWLNHEWLTEVLMGWLYNHLGVLGLKLMKLGCTALVVVFLVVAMGETGASTLMQFALLLVACVAIEEQVQFRPQIFTFALLSGLLAMLSRMTYRGRAPLWLAIPMLALWANLHGGFIMGIAALGVYTAVVGAQDLLGGRGMMRAGYLAAVTVAATLATLLTPYGLETWHAVLRALGNPYTRSVIYDWQPLTKSALRELRTGPAGFYQMIVAAAVYAGLAVAVYAGLVVAFLMSPRADDLPLFCVAAVMIAAAFVAIRNLPIAVIACLAPLARHLTLLLEARRESRGTRAPERLAHSGRLSQLVITMAALALGLATGLFSPRMPAAGRYPLGAVRFMHAHHLAGNILTSFGWGEYLIWHMAPASKVFIDGRYDTVYPLKVIGDYLNFQLARPSAARVLREYPHDFVLISSNIPAYKLMRAQADWKVLYRDQNCVLFARAKSFATKIPGVPVSAEAPKTAFP